jgi:hypothetical protein
MPATLPRMKADDLLTGDVREFFQRFADTKCRGRPRAAPSSDQASASEGAGAPSM